MRVATSFFRRLRLWPAKAETMDVFDLRLARIGAREPKSAQHRRLFRAPLQPRAA